MESHSLMLSLAVASLSVAGLILVLRTPRPSAYREELASLGWTPTVIRAISGAGGLLGTLVILAVGTVQMGWRAGVPLAAAVGVWLPRVISVLLRAAVLSGYRTGRDRALLVWLQRVRLYTALGMPTAASAVEAAEQVSHRAFASVAASIHAALQSGSDPLAAAAQKVAGSSAETLLATVTTVERSGAAGTSLIDRIVERAIETLTNQHRQHIERQGRTLAAVTTLIALLSGLVVMAAVAFTLPGLA